MSKTVGAARAQAAASTTHAPLAVAPFAVERLQTVTDTAMLAPAAAASDPIKGSDGDDRITLTDPTGGPNTTEGADRVQGLAGNDYIDGAGGDDRLDGGNGHDSVFGGSGYDVINAGAGNDVAAGGDGNDRLLGGAGDDSAYFYDDQSGSYIHGLEGGAGNDSIDGGTGNDYLNGGRGADTLSGGDGDDEIDASEYPYSDEADLIHGGSGADYIIADRTDQVFGDADDDIIKVPIYFWDQPSGPGGYIDGGDGNDDIFADRLNDGSRWFGGAGADTLQGSGGFGVRMDGGEGDDVLSWGSAFAAANASLVGGAGADQISARNGTVWVDAGLGDDVVTLGVEGSFGAALEVTVALGDGVDTVRVMNTTTYADSVSTVNDFRPGAGGDRLDVSGLLSGLVGYDGGHPFLAGWLRLVADGNDTLLQVAGGGVAGASDWVTSVRLQGVEVASLTADNFAGGLTPGGEFTPRSLRGTSGDDSLIGADGNDKVSGRGGNDLLQGGYGGDDSVSGGDGLDTLVGGVGADVLRGEAGDDVALGGSGNDSLYGGDGDDNAYAEVSTNGYWQGGSGLVGGDGDDWIDGGAGNDLLAGGNGSDTLYGGDGNDSLFTSGDAQDGVDIAHGGLGDDLFVTYGQASIYGEAGNDHLSLSNFSGVADAGLGDDSFVIEASGVGASTGSTLSGGDGRDTFQGWSGADVNILAGTGDDQIMLDEYGALRNWTINAGAGDDRIELAGAGHTVIGGDGDDFIAATGEYGADSISRITAGNGIDTIAPSISLPTGWYGPSLRQELTVTDFRAGAGGDRIDLSRINSALGLPTDADPFASGRLRLTASGSQTLFEIDANGDGTQFVTVLALQQTAPGALTADNFVQQVTAVISANAATARVDADKTVTLIEDSTVELGLARPTDPDGGSLSIMIVSRPNGSLTLKNGEPVYEGQTLTAGELASLRFEPHANVNGDVGTFRYSVTDDEGSTVLRDVHFQVTPIPDAPIVQIYSNVSYVDSGSTPFHLDLSQSIYDPDGPSPLSYSITVDGGQPLPSWLSFDPQSGQLTGTPTYGTRQTWAIEVQATDADGLVGSGSFELSPANYASIYGTDAAETLLGSSGHDDINSYGGDDWLDGRAGSSTLQGGSGNDTYVAHSSQDVVYEDAGQGTDTVRAEVDHTLGENLENLVLLATATTGIGNTLDNHLTGNALANTLSGDAGYDTLLGGAGNDQLSGGGNADWFVFEASAAANGRDAILDLQVGVGRDVIDLSAFFGPNGGSTLDGDTARGDAFDVFTAPSTLQGQHVLALEDALGGQAPGGGDLAALLAGFHFDNGSKQVFVVNDTDSGQGYVAFGVDRAGDGNDTLEAAELKVVASLDFAPGQDFDGLDSGNFATRAQPANQGGGMDASSGSDSALTETAAVSAPSASQMTLDLQASSSLAHHAFSANLWRAASEHA